MFLRNKFICPMDGIIKPIKDIEDEVFSSGSMGDGFMIDYDGEEVVSPITGTVIAIYPTGHALGLKDKKGREFILHIGLESFDLNENIFKPHVKQGDYVQAGDKLVTVSAQQMRDNNLSTSSAIVCPSGEKIKLLKSHCHVSAGEKNIIRIIGK